MSRARVLIVAALLLGLTAGVAEAAPPTKGVKLTPSALVNAPGGFTCGYIKGKWRAGKLLTRTRLWTFTDQAKVAHKAGKRKQARRLEAKAKAGAKPCRLSGTPPTPVQPGIPPSYVPTQPGPPTPLTPVRFDLTGAAGIAAPAPQGRQAPIGSNIRVVDAAGGTRDAIVEGSARVSQFLIAPNDRLYVLFNFKVPLAGSPAETSCLLAEIQRDGTQACVDGNLGSVSWGSEGSYSRMTNPGVQFDDAGNIYYMGTTTDGRFVLRRSAGGQTTDLITDSAYASDFLVLGDGTVLLSGTTPVTRADWLRRLSPAGVLRTLTDRQSSFLQRYPDGNVYFGADGVERYLVAEDRVDPRAWIGYQRDYDKPQPYFENLVPCADYAGASCSFSASSVTKTFTTLDGKVFVINGYSPSGVLMQYFPELRQTSTSVAKVTVAEGLVSDVILTGLTKDKRNTTSLYDTRTDKERVLIGPDAEVEIYHLNYRQSDNAVLFDGLRFSDNTYVLGRIDMSTGKVTTSAKLSGRLSAFETFR